MQRLAKVLNKDNFIPELGYLVVTGDGMIVYNGQIGIKYSKKQAGSKFCDIAAKSGTYAFPDPITFFKTLKVLEDVKSVALVKSESSITIKFAGKGVVKIPVVMNVHKDIPHLHLNWMDVVKHKAKGIPINSNWEELTKLTISDAPAQFGVVLGIYGYLKRLVSFDLGVYIHGDPENVPDFYCPRALLELGLKDVEFAIVKDDEIYLVGAEVQYAFFGSEESEATSDFKKLEEDISTGDVKKVTLDYTSGLWKRMKTLSNESLTLKITKGKIFVGHDTWSECIGKTEAQDIEFTTRASLLERWGSSTLEHGILLSAEGSWFIYGKTRGGMHFYGALSKEYIHNEEAIVTKDVQDGASLL